MSKRPSLQGLRHPRHLRRRARWRRRRAGRPAFVRVLADLAGKPAGDLRLGLGRDMRLSAPEIAARYRAGMVAEGAHVLDVGQVGTEMLYFLVGSRELDGGLMCTASHNPKAYTGAKLVSAARSRSPATRASTTSARPDRGGLGDAPGGGSAEEVDITEEFQERGAALHRPGQGHAAARRRRRRQRHGGPDGRPAARAPRHRPRHHLLEARRRLPRPRAQPPARGEPHVHHRPRPRRGRRPRHRLGRRRRPLLLHRRAGPLRRRRLPDRADGRARCWRSEPRRDILYDVRASRAVADVVERARRRAHEPRRPRLLQGPHARGGRDLRRRGLRPLLLPRLLQRRLGDDPGAADAREAVCRGQAPQRAARALPLDVLHLRRDQLRGGRRGEDGGDRGALRRRADRTSTASASTTTTGTSTCAPRTPSRCCGCAWSRWSPARTWSAAATRSSA